MASMITVGVDNERVESAIGFDCIGRWIKAGPWKQGDPPGRGCDWTLGGLFHIHPLGVVMPDDKMRLCFEPATPEEAQQLMAQTVKQLEASAS